jgi:hypothetical protein
LRKERDFEEGGKKEEEEKMEGTDEEDIFITINVRKGSHEKFS